jgi:hypothetical protein
MLQYECPALASVSSPDPTRMAYKLARLDPIRKTFIE